MNQEHKGFALRTHSRFPAQMSMMYLGWDFAGQGIVRELSRSGCRIFGNYAVFPGETLSLRISLTTCPKPLFIEQVTVQWVKEQEFGVAFDHLDEQESVRLQQMLNEFLGSGHYSNPPASPNGEVQAEGHRSPLAPA